MNKKGFTLIELLAVIIILGILMIIAIPSVTRYISDSRKNAYVDTAKEIIGGARNIVNGGKLEMYSTNTTYYIPTSCIKTENAQKSPYGDFTQAYVGVIYDGKGYKYYWISVDDAGEGVSKITPLDKLDVDDIESDLKASDIEGVVQTTGIGNRSEIYILDCQSNEWETQRHLDDTSNNVPEEGGGSSSNAVVYPTGKTKDTVVTGDIVKIGTEEFYVINNNTTNNKLTLLSHYNLNVGNNKKPGVTEGIQNSEVRGNVASGTMYGNVAFVDSMYWIENNNLKSGYSGVYCDGSNYSVGTKCAYVYDNNSNLYQYVEAYKNYLINEFEAPNSIEARVMKIEEAHALGCDAWSCNGAPSWVYETSYWLGATWVYGWMWRISNYGSLDYSSPYTVDGGYGVRPVIVI